MNGSTVPCGLCIYIFIYNPGFLSFKQVLNNALAQHGLYVDMGICASCGSSRRPEFLWLSADIYIATKYKHSNHQHAMPCHLPVHFRDWHMIL